MFKWAAAEELIPATIFQALSMVVGLRRGRTEAKETAPVMPVDDAIVDATLEHLPPIPADMVRFQRFTGCRPIEVRTVRPCDIDRSGDVWEYRPESHKTEHHGRSRVIFIGPHAQEILLRYLVRDSQMYCFRPCDSEEKRLSARNAARKTPKNCGNTRGSNRKRRPKRKPREDDPLLEISFQPKTADPSEEEIRQRCKAIRATWSPATRRLRAGCYARRQVELPVVKVE